MSADPAPAAQEIERARAWHRQCTNTPGMAVCQFCFADWPCLTKRLAEALEQEQAGSAALRQMALALIYVAGPEVRETARKELDNQEAGAEFLAQLTAARADATAQRARAERLEATIQGCLTTRDGWPICRGCGMTCPPERGIQHTADCWVVPLLALIASIPLEQNSAPPEPGCE